ncbi:ATP-dependent DNA helicase Rep [Eikenella corrodens ATCC 23834]|uniref:ATP-dependent DNA helicase Rep n=1 Tax=Eikenella corrodens ATCC 23834 TaxID=546274 RepID=C0DYJ0_EIKCO|nr:ATP-dependent DNA helicase Rep [Eikenella corrodens ATCC 23834]
MLAGAGSGKTRVITEKIAHLIREVGYAPHNIAAITFTNKAAAEMQERTAAMLGSRQTRGLTVCTFHSLGMRLLREEAQHIGYKKNFSVFDGSDSGKSSPSCSAAAAATPSSAPSTKSPCGKTTCSPPSKPFR